MYTSLADSRKVEFRRLKLGVQLVLVLVVVSALVGAITAVSVRSLEYDYLKKAITEASERKFEMLIAASIENIISEDVPKLSTIVNQLTQRDPMLQRLNYFNEAGIGLIEWDQNTPIVERNQLVFSSDIIFQGEKFGRVNAIWDSSSAEREATRHAYFMAGVASAACLALCLLIYATVNGLVIVPLQNILQRLENYRLAHFDLNQALPAGRSFEISELNASVNALGEYMKNHQSYTLELARAKTVAEEANHSKTQFLANVSHELRTPLNAINGFSEMMTMKMFGSLGDKRYDDYARHINQSGLHLLSLINDILDISKLESGKFELHRDLVNLHNVINVSTTTIEELAMRGGVRLIKQFDGNLPPALVDERRIHQILLNLLSNAVKFTHPGGTVTVRASWHDSYGAIISVADTGIGIAADKIQVAMEPFGQVENAYSRTNQGSGLGLPLTKSLVEMHGGKLQIESQINIGTTVTFNIPIACFRRAEATPAPVSASPAEGAKAGLSQAGNNAPLLRAVAGGNNFHSLH